MGVSTHPFRRIVTIINRRREPMLRAQTVFDVDACHAELGRQEATERFFVVETAYAPAAT